MKWLFLSIGFVILAVGAIAAIGAMLPVNHSASRRARFRQSPQTLYGVIAGPPAWRSDIKTYGPLPEVDGRKHWYEQGPDGKKIAYELVEDSPPSRRVTRIADKNLPFGGTWIIEIRPVSEKESEVRLTENGEVYNIVFRFVSRFVMGYYGSIDSYLADLGKKFGEQPSVE